MLVWLVFLVLYQQVWSVPIDSEDGLPPYLRGMGWRNVEEELKKDLRLDPSIRPISYDINLNVSVRGYGGAERSTFNGYVMIALNTSKPTNKIELHSVGLSIKKAELILPTSTIEVTKIDYNRERETVIFTLPLTIKPTDSAQLRIYYNGTAVMRGVGLYEYWTKPEAGAPSPLPTISLVTSCEPAGARRWFPSFDEPDKKAKFGLRVVHPTALLAYSNTAGETKVLGDGLSETTFKPTVPLPTYIVALALTAQLYKEVEHNGQKIRAIGRNRAVLVEGLKKSIDDVRSLRAVQNVTFIPEKTDWLVAQDFVSGAMENPGLIVSSSDAHGETYRMHELVHMYFGNLATLRSWEQIWINEGFADYFQTAGVSTKSPYDVLSGISIHESAIHQKFSYAKSQFLYSHFLVNLHVHYQKAGQLLSLIRRYIGADSFDRALNRYLIDNSFGNGDSEMMIGYLSKEKPEAREILMDWVYQPGVALLTVEEEREQIVIRQRRFLRTDFIAELRDSTTRWTIPLYCKINGAEHMFFLPKDVEKVVIAVPANSTFSVDQSYPHLYAVHYSKRSSEDRLSHLIAQTEITQKLRNYTESLDHVEKPRFSYLTRRTRAFCKKNAVNKTVDDLWKAYYLKGDTEYLLCNRDLRKRDNAMRFLHGLLLTNELPVRNSQLGELVKLIDSEHSGVLLDFIDEENENIELLGYDVLQAIKTAAKNEKGGLEKIRQIVRKNPAFGANFYHTITKIFEENFIKTEKVKRGLPLDEENENDLGEFEIDS